MPIRLSFVIAIVLALRWTTVAAQSPVAAYGRDAECVAALKSTTGMMAARVRDGDEPARAELSLLTEAGLAFVGAAYKAGLRKEEADRLLQAAEDAQKDLTDAARARLGTACRAEGEVLLAAAEPFERAVIKAAAERRVKRLLATR